MLQLRQIIFFTFPFCLILTLCSLAQKKSTDQLIDPKLTEFYTLKVPVVVPARTLGDAPSDAIILFDGHGLGAWKGKNGIAAPWGLVDDYFKIIPGTGGLTSKEAFGNIQLHLEFKSPLDTLNKVGQQRGNSGIFFMGKYEVQILDCYRNSTYVNGQVGTVYKQHVPKANSLRSTGEWQAFDIIFTAPTFDKKEKLVKPAYITVMLNGVLLLNHVEIKGPTVYRGEPKYVAHGPKAPLYLQDHGNPVAFRNIWVRPI